MIYGWVRKRRLWHPLANDGMTTICGRRIQGQLAGVPPQVCQKCLDLADPLGRMLRRVQRMPSGCWHWTGGISSQKGYGRVWFNDETVSAHWAIYVLTKGSVPTGWQVDHLCHNADPACVPASCLHRRCVNPDHLEAVPPAVNQQRQGARKTHCPQGHEYTPENTVITHKASRGCKKCSYIRAGEHRSRKRRLAREAKL